MIGITDRKVADNLGPYAVGYMYSNAAANDGQVFIYSVGAQTFRFLGTKLGPPEQVSNRDYDASDPVVSFVGNSPIPYIWVGSPNGDSQYAHNGSEHDMWAFLDGDNKNVPQLHPSALTGINRDFAFGGYGDPGQSNETIGASTPSTWTSAHGTRTSTLVKGLGYTGALDSLTYADGKFATVTRAPKFNPDDPEIEIQVQETLTTYPVWSKMRVRVTARRNEQTSLAMNVYVWKWITSEWVPIGGSNSLPEYMQTSFAETETFAPPYTNPYIDAGTGRMKAKVTISLNGTYTEPWSVSFEQLKFTGLPPS